MRDGQPEVGSKCVGGLADRSYDIVNVGIRVFGAYVFYAVYGLIECRTNQVGEAGIDNGKFLFEAMFDIKYLCEECAALSYDGTTEFKMYFLSRAQGEIAVDYIEKTGEIRYGICGGVIIVYAQTSPYINRLEENSAVVIFVLKSIDAFAEYGEWCVVGNL